MDSWMLVASSDLQNSKLSEPTKLSRHPSGLFIILVVGVVAHLAASQSEFGWKIEFAQGESESRAPDN